MAYKLKNKNSVGMMASSPLYNTPKPDRAEYDSKEAYDQAMVAYDRSQTPAAPIPSETKDVRGDIKEKGTPVVKGAMQGSSGPNVQFGGDGRRILKSGGGDVGAGSGTGGGKNQNIIGIPKDPYFGGRGVSSGLTSSFAGTAKLGTTFKPQPLVIPKAKTQDKKVKKTTTSSTSTSKKTKPQQKLKIDRIAPRPITNTRPEKVGTDAKNIASKMANVIGNATNANYDMIANKPASGRRQRIQRRLQKRQQNLENRIANRADKPLIKQDRADAKELRQQTRRKGRESASQERKNLLMDNPVAKDAAGGRKSSQPQQPKATQESKMSRKTKRQLKRSNKFSESLSGATNKNLKSGGSQDFRGMKGDKSGNKATFDYSGGKNKYKKNAKI